MKKLIVCVLLLSLLLCGCTAKQWEAEPALFEYPGLKWGMKSEDVQTVLGYSNAVLGNTEILNEGTENEFKVHWYSIGKVEMFGLPTSLVILRFMEYPGCTPGLCGIRICFPDGYGGGPTTDMEAVKAMLFEQYGAPRESYTMPSWDWKQGTLHERQSKVEQKEDNTVWYSAVTGDQLLSDEQMEKLYGLMTEKWAAEGHDHVPTLEQYRQLRAAPAATMYLRTFHILRDHPLTGEAREKGATEFVLDISGGTVVDHLNVNRFFE